MSSIFRKTGEYQFQFYAEGALMSYVLSMWHVHTIMLVIKKLVIVDI